MLRLYDLVWKRGIASQMASAEIERTTAEIVADNAGKKAGLRATGSVIRFDGFIAAYTDMKEDGEQADDGDEDGRLPEINARENLAKQKINASQHFTEPPPRYSEATLIKKMEELGIGRPSTYAATVTTLIDRDYVEIDKRKLVPQAKGRLVTAFLESFFTRYVEYDFTASLEEKLDQISAGELNWKDVLRDFWKDFSPRSRTPRNCASPTARCAQRGTGSARLPEAGRWRRPAHLSGLRHRQAVPEARQIRRFRRMLQLPGMQLHAPTLLRQQR